jgi:crossover junction endodeoxyribonuclease RuvC
VHRGGAGEPPAEASALRILGVDPGSRITGYGVVESDGRRVRHRASGCIRAGGGSQAAGLARISGEISALIREWRPDVVAVESVFTRGNSRSALVLGQARGAVLAACGLAGVVVAEYAPAQIKSAVTGSGAAEKLQVQRMVALLLDWTGALAADEADALACALCHAQTLQLSRALGGGAAAAARAPRRRSARVARALGRVP